MAAVLLAGSRVWPGVWVGAFLANLWDFTDPVNSLPFSAHFGASFGIASGSTLQALLGAALLRRWNGGPNVLDCATAFFRFVGVGMLMCLVASTVGLASLWLAGFVPGVAVATLWATWWLGDAAGVLVVTPFLLAWSRSLTMQDVLRPLAEAGLLVALLLAVSVVVFVGRNPHGPGSGPLAYLTVPFVVWAAFAFGPRGVTAALLLHGTIAVWGTAAGRGPFVRESLNESLLLLQTFVCV